MGMEFERQVKDLEELINEVKSLVKIFINLMLLTELWLCQSGYSAEQKPGVAFLFSSSVSTLIAPQS